MFQNKWFTNGKGLTVLSTLLLLMLPATTLQASSCEWCGAQEAPANVPLTTMTIADANEPGERLRITGTVYQRDGKTPAADVLLFAYQTNAAGVYPRRGDERGNAKRQGYLRGWLRTDASGRYELLTIRPGVYPSRNEPAHIHMTIGQPGHEEYWIDDILFEGDPLITDRILARQKQRGGHGVIKLERDSNGTWQGVRDIVLLH